MKSNPVWRLMKGFKNGWRLFFSSVLLTYILDKLWTFVESAVPATLCGFMFVSHVKKLNKNSCTENIFASLIHRKYTNMIIFTHLVFSTAVTSQWIQVKTTETSLVPAQIWDVKEHIRSEAWNISGVVLLIQIPKPSSTNLLNTGWWTRPELSLAGSTSSRQTLTVTTKFLLKWIRSKTLSWIYRSLSILLTSPQTFIR